MYQYYEQATICYAYLGDVHGTNESTNVDDLTAEISRSVWFTRGWTLQELIAPSQVIFFNSEWVRLWSKAKNSRELRRITHIGRGILEGKATLTDYSLAQRMAWAASRTRTRIEDEAYCLLGIFQVNMVMLYGEGKNAFRRLQEEIIKQFDDQTLLVWHDDRSEKPILAPSASCFADQHDLKCIYATNDARLGFTLSNAGLNIKLMLIPWDMDVYVAPLSCGHILSKKEKDSEDGQKMRSYSRMGIFLRRTKHENHLVRVSVDIKHKKTDIVMLDSDVVAAKRDTLQIRNRQVFLRQSLIEILDRIHHSFSFSFNHPGMFQGGHMPFSVMEVSSDAFEVDYVVANSGFVREPYSHHESVSFDISRLSPDHRQYRLRLGFDMDFRPICIITDALENKTASKRHDGQDQDLQLDGMHKPLLLRKSLYRLMTMLEAGQTSGTLLALRAKHGASTVMRCKELSLKIEFALKIRSFSIPDKEIQGKMWHVTFEPLTSIPSTASSTTLTEQPFGLLGGGQAFLNMLADMRKKHQPKANFFKHVKGKADGAKVAKQAKPVLAADYTDLDRPYTTHQSRALTIVPEYPSSAAYPPYSTTEQPMASYREASRMTEVPQTSFPSESYVPPPMDLAGRPQHNPPSYNVMQMYPLSSNSSSFQRTAYWNSLKQTPERNRHENKIYELE